MWIFAVEGFVSVVAVRGSKTQLMVRARVRDDLVHWARLCGEKKFRRTPAADYHWRFTTTRKKFALAVVKKVGELRYDNFKNAVGHDDPHRAEAYLDVWSAMHRLQQQKDFPAHFR